MKKSLSLVIVAALLSFVPAAPVAAPAVAAQPGFVAACRDLLETLPEANLGECISFGLAAEAGFPPHLCDSIEEIDPDFFYSVYDSIGDCVRTARGN